MRRTPNAAALEFRRDLRRHGTDAESMLWRILRGRSLGAKFRRQHPVGRYVLDFYCPERHVAIELDGNQHSTLEGARYDAGRTERLTRQGIRVLRFTNLEVLAEVDAVFVKIRRALGEAE